MRSHIPPTSSPEFKQKDKVPANPKRKKKCQMTSLPSVFQFGSDQQWHFAEHKKEKGPLNPLRISPRFLVRGLAGCSRQRREDPGGLILWSFFLVVLGYMVCNVLVGGRFPPLRPYVPGRSCPPLALVGSVRSFSLQYVRRIFIYIYNTVLLLHFVIEGYTKEKLHTIQTDFKPPTPSLSQGCCQFWIFLEFLFCSY